MIGAKPNKNRTNKNRTCHPWHSGGRSAKKTGATRNRTDDGADDETRTAHATRNPTRPTRNPNRGATGAGKTDRDETPGTATRTTGRPKNRNAPKKPMSHMIAPPGPNPEAPRNPGSANQGPTEPGRNPNRGTARTADHDETGPPGTARSNEPKRATYWTRPQVSAPTSARKPRHERTESQPNTNRTGQRQERCSN